MMSDLHPDNPDNRPRPETLTDLFVSFTLLALQGFGGVLAVVQRELVEKKRWLTQEEFIEDWSVAQIMPGPNVINLALIVGSRYFGLKGAVVGLAGMMAVPLVLVLTLALIYSQFANHPNVAGALRGMGAVAAGLILATGIKLISALKTNVLGWRWCTALGLACLLGIVVIRLPLAYVFFGLGGVAFTLTFRRLKP
jgi:chromate transporter